MERVAPHTALSFVSFSLGLFFQRKAAKYFWYQRSFNAFSFETIGTKEKALQKENAVMRSRRAGATFEKEYVNPQNSHTRFGEPLGRNNRAMFVLTTCSINQNSNAGGR